ncbi:MAG TPA: hypothetical protein VFJ94_15765, partial [Intrasporangium sp.]|uniref:hypothetical protein n=1 Tax=Intrasporangium sp. TaxID=1925024 RepID=UPI002D82B0F6|nr:hypothetical protein [Intrasporangium sp.]
MRSTVRLLSVGAVAAATLLAAPSAFAADSAVTQAVTGGTLTASAADLTLAGVTTTHSAQNSTGTMTITADDSTGTGAGWNVTEQVSNLIYTGSYTGTDIPAANLA